MGAIADRLVLTLAEVKEHLRVDDTDEDDVISTYIDAAKMIADDYCQNEFLDGAGAELDIPSPVKLWVLKHIARSYELKALGLQIEQVTGAGMVNWDDADPEELRAYRDYSQVSPL